MDIIFPPRYCKSGLSFDSAGFEPHRQFLVTSDREDCRPNVAASSGSREIRLVRSSSTESTLRASILARGRSDAVMDPPPEGHMTPRDPAAQVNLVGMLEFLASRLPAAQSNNTVAPAGISTPPSVVSAGTVRIM